MIISHNQSSFPAIMEVKNGIVKAMASWLLIEQNGVSVIDQESITII